MSSFRDTFRIKKTQSPSDPSEAEGHKVFYDWSDLEYRNFMMDLLTKLEPRKEKSGSILFEELDEINEIFYVAEG